MTVPKPPIKKTPLKPSVRLRSWEEVLDLAGFPRDVVILDFETFFTSDYSLRKMSTIEHIMDEQFEVLGLVTLYSDTEKPIFARGEMETAYAIRRLQHQYGENLERCTVVAHNAKYDTGILNFRYGIRPKYIVDTMGLASHWNARAKAGLEELAKEEGLPPKGDTSLFKEWTTRKRYKKRGGRGKLKNMPVQLPIITDPMWKQIEDYANNDGFLEWELFKKYMPRMSCPEIELDALNHTLHLYIDPVIEVDEETALDLIDEMEVEIDRVMEVVHRTRSEISGENSFESILTDALEAAGDSVGQYLKPAKNKRGCKLAIAKNDYCRELLEKHASEFVRQLMEAKNALSSWPNHIKRVKRIVAQCRAAGGVLPVPLRYFGAHTGRWSGDEKINLQNLGSRGHELVNRIRTLLVAPPGYEFVIADAASIESRVTAWQAGQDDKLVKFEAGEEMYCRLAEIVLNKKPGSLRKPVPEHLWVKLGCIPEIEKRYKKCRNTYGKTGDLACGYGGGEAAVERFAPELSCEMRLKIRDTYRKLHPKVVEYWHEVERKFIYTAKYGKPCSMKRGVSFRQTPDVDVIITLPSGREIKYHKVRITEEKRTSKAGNEYINAQAKVFNPKERKWEYIWGGTLTENIVQAIARDILWAAILTVEKAGYRVVHHVHDELIALVKKGQGPMVLELAIKALQTRLSWAPELPLDGEGVVTNRYGGH